MTWRSDWRRANRAAHLLQRASTDAYVASGPDGAQRLAKRLIRRSLLRTLLRGVR